MTPTLSTAMLAAKDAATDDRFGWAVAATTDTIVVGVPDRTTGGQPLQGAVYVFTKPAAGWSSASAPATLTVASDGNGDRFGYAVAVQGDTIVVGAPEYHDGALFVFTKPQAGWVASSTPTATLTSDPLIDDEELGSAVAIDGDTIVGGAPTYTPTISLPNTGAALLYTEPAGGWVDNTQTAILSANDESATDYRGRSVAVSGNTVVVGAWNRDNGEGAAYVYVKPTGPWTDTTEDADLAATDQAEGDDFGYAVAISGSTVAVGSPYHQSEKGAVYVYNEPTTGWASKTARTVSQNDELTASNTVVGGAIGLSLAFSGNTIAAGGPFFSTQDHEQVGEALAFTRPTTGWTGAQTESGLLLARKPGTATDSLGASVAVAGTSIVAGADDYSTNEQSDVGEVLIFGPKSAVKPTPKPTLTKVTESPKKWKLGRALPAVNPKRKPRGGTEFSFHLNEKATVSFTFARSKGAEHKRVLRASFRAGENHLYFDGAITKKARLSVGTYKVSIVATNAAGRSPAAHELAHVVQQ